MNSMKKVLRLGVAVIWASGVWAFGGQDRHTRLAATPAQQQTNAGLVAAWEKDAGRPALQRRNPRYQIEYGDVIELNFPFTSDFNQTVTVQPDGYISLIGAGDLHVEGQTTPELRDRLREVYGKPGKYDLRGFITATQAVAMAGGFNDQAKHSQVLLFRRTSNNWVEVKKLNLKKLLHAENLSEDVALQPGDMLFVPKSTIGKIRRYLPTQAVSMYVNPAGL